MKNIKIKNFEFISSYTDDINLLQAYILINHKTYKIEEWVKLNCIECDSTVDGFSLYDVFYNYKLWEYFEFEDFCKSFINAFNKTAKVNLELKVYTGVYNFYAYY